MEPLKNKAILKIEKPPKMSDLILAPDDNSNKLMGFGIVLALGKGDWECKPGDRVAFRRDHAIILEFDDGEFAGVKKEWLYGEVEN